MSFQARIARFCERHPDAPQDLILLSRTFMRASQQMQQAIASALEPCGMAYPQYLAMAMLHADQPHELNPSEMVRLLDMTPTQVTRLIDSLASAGWVERQLDVSDRRRLQLTLTAEGTSRLQLAMPLVHQIYRQIWQSCTPGDIAQFRNVLEQLLAKTQDQPFA